MQWSSLGARRCASAGLALILLASAVSCSSGGGLQTEESGALVAGEGWPDALDDGAERHPAAAVPTLALPWEVRGLHGETFLPNLYYADPADNEQIMPLAIAGNRVQIRNLVYPTLGNPNLFVKSDSLSLLPMILRLEGERLEHLHPEVVAATGDTFGQDPELVDRLDFETQDDQNKLRFLILARDQRSKAVDATPVNADGVKVFEVSPTRLLADKSSPYMPKAFMRRWTLRAIFDGSSLAAVPEGFYDLRIEVLKQGAVTVTEWQPNALRIFKKGPEASNGTMTVLNVTDTQISVGAKFDGLTLDKFRQWVEHIKSTYESGQDPAVKRAAFITFNGDLHNGGSPFSLSSQAVSRTYNLEAQRAFDLLKELPLPIFLTVGNHDGMASMGVVPEAILKDEEAVNQLGIDFKLPLREILAEEKKQGRVGWEDFTQADFDARVSALKNEPGGHAVNIVSGAHLRRIPAYDAEVQNGSVRWIDRAWRVGWKPLPRTERNWVLYDGFYQWQTTYGPTYFSWTFGKNHFVSLNTYELRQHRRSGWGMYTVNYGGWVSPVQMAWLDGELDRAQRNDRDITLLMHHDPRGGHEGADFPYYFEQLPYAGVGRSLSDYVLGDQLAPAVCEHVPAWALSAKNKLNCLHDGVQEWMRPDREFDCRPEDRLVGDPQYRCDPARFKLGDGQPAHAWYSGYALISRLAGQRTSSASPHPNLRTVVAGHVHYNSLEIVQAGEALVPGVLALDASTQQRLAREEAKNPLRVLAGWFKAKLKLGEAPANDPSLEEVAKTYTQDGIFLANQALMLDLRKAGHDYERTLQPESSEEAHPRELAILRTTSNADLTDQSYGSDALYGYQIFEIYPKADARHYHLPQINTVQYTINRGGEFSSAGSAVDLDRAASLKLTDPKNLVRTRFPLRFKK